MNTPRFNNVLYDITIGHIETVLLLIWLVCMTGYTYR